MFIFAAVSVSLNDGNYVGFLGYAMIKSVNNERSNVLVGMEDVYWMSHARIEVPAFGNTDRLSSTSVPT